jgi:hypothetical protein
MSAVSLSIFPTAIGGQLADQWVSAILEEFSEKDSNRSGLQRSFRYCAITVGQSPSTGGHWRHASERLRRGGVFDHRRDRRNRPGHCQVSGAILAAKACVDQETPFPNGGRGDSYAERGGASGDLAIIDQLLELEQLGAQVGGERRMR